MTQLLNVSASRLAGNPTRSCAVLLIPLWRRCDLAVESHSGFERDQRNAMANVFRKGFIQWLGLGFEQSNGNRNPSLAKRVESLPTDQRIWILHRCHNAANSRSDNGVRAWAGSALVRAWLQIDVQRPGARISPGLVDGNDFRVTKSIVGIEALSNNQAIAVYDNCANIGIGRS
jgi:hypothetical protein